MDLIGGGSGALAMQVWDGAGLEHLGLNDGDILIITIMDPEEGAPAFASIHNKAVIGWYRTEKDGQITIGPFAEGVEPMTADLTDVQVVCELKAIGRLGQRLHRP
ncbi:MAG: hypothetical protein ACREDR_23445 [Blastocatellia bacterium]